MKRARIILTLRNPCWRYAGANPAASRTALEPGKGIIGPATGSPSQKMTMRERAHQHDGANRMTRLAKATKSGSTGH